MSERRGGPFDLFTVNDAKFYQRSLLVEDGLMGACAKTRGVTPNTWMKTCAPSPGPPSLPANRGFGSVLTLRRRGWRGRGARAAGGSRGRGARGGGGRVRPAPAATRPTPMI